MISLTCTSCKKVLQIDDAFAGGVCRCQHCGTIQTVPSTLRRSARPGAPSSGSGAKTLYQKTTPSKTGTGLEELAEAVTTSSGLARNALKTRAAAPPAAPARRVQMPVIYAAGGVGAVVLVFILWMVFHSPAKPTSGDGATTEPTTSLPTFGTIPLDVTSVVYLIDRGDSTRFCFSELKEVTLKSIATLGPDRRFAVIFWNNGTEAAFPTAGLAKANEGQVDAARRALDEVYPFGQTDMRGPLQQAIDLKPAAVVIATGKGWDLDTTFVRMVDDTAGGTGVKIHCFTIGAGGSSKPLETIATRYGGEYREVTEDQLRSWSR